MIILLETATDRMVFDNVTDIKERTKTTIFGDKKVVNLYYGEMMIVGGDDIDLGAYKLTILPNAEREEN